MRSSAPSALGRPLAIHLAESEAETALIRDGAGPFADALRRRGIAVAPRARSPVALLERLGVLAAHPLLIHCVRVDAADIAAIAAHDCAVAHCPLSNARSATAPPPLAELLAAGIRIGLGSDSMASNDRMDILAEARLAILQQQSRNKDLTAAKALELATLGGAARARSRRARSAPSTPASPPTSPPSRCSPSATARRRPRDRAALEPPRPAAPTPSSSPAS